MDSTNNSVSTGKYGVPFMTVSQFQSWINIHPDHVGFVIGAKGATVKKIASDCRCYVKIQEPNQFSCGFPWFVIKGSTEINVCEAYHRIRTIANEAERRLPRLSNVINVLPEPTENEPYVLGAVPPKKKKFKVNTVIKKPESPTYSPESPTYSPESPTYSPHSPSLAKHNG